MSAEANQSGREPYVAFEEQSLHRRGCLDPSARERNLDVDIVRVRVEKETSLMLSVRGDERLEPGVVITADEGEASKDGWLREVVSRDGRSLATPVILPVAGAYTFIIVDRRELIGDEMSSGHGCFAADLEPAAPPVQRRLPLVWRGTIGAPMAFEVATTARPFTLIEASNVGGNGIAMVSVFEDGVYVRTVTVAPKQHAEIVVATHDGAARLLLQEASSWGSLPVVISLRPIGYPRERITDDSTSERVTVVFP